MGAKGVDSGNLRNNNCCKVKYIFNMRIKLILERSVACRFSGVSQLLLSLNGQF